MKIFTIVLYFAILVGVTLSNRLIPNVFSHHLCSPCKFLFKEVKKVMPTVSKDTEQQFRNTVQKTCDRRLKTIPLLDEVCKQVTEDTIEEVFKDLDEAERLIDPDEISRKMHMCN